MDHPETVDLCNSLAANSIEHFVRVVCPLYM